MIKIERGPKVWGPDAWSFLEHIALNYPIDPTIEVQEEYRNFFYSLIQVLPCSECAEHYYENITENPIRLNNRFELITWIIEIHNAVNKKNKKTLFSLQDFLFKYGITLQDLFT